MMRVRWLGVWLVCGMVCGAAREAAAADELLLAGRGANSVIVTPTEKPPYRYPYWGGEAILARFLKEVTGRAVPVMTAREYAQRGGARRYAVRLWVGRSPRVDRAIGSELDRIDDDGFVILARGSDVYVAGQHDWGTHFAAYDLLERFAACRWYAPGPRFWEPAKDGVVGLLQIVPKAAQVRMPADTRIVAEPSYKMRWLRHLPPHAFRMRRRDQFHHALSRILPPRTLGRSHPEYFPLIDGKRYVPPPGREHDFQPCVSNPGVLEIVVSAAEKYFAEHPREGSFSIGMNDSNKFCQCPACRALAPASLTDPRHRTAYAFFHFYNQVAERLAKTHPDKRLGCLAYSTLGLLPAGAIRLHPNVVPYLTRDSAQLFDPREVKEFRETVGRWSKLARRMGIYEYVYGRGFVVPRIYDRYLLANIRTRYGVGTDGFYAEDYPNWGLDGPKYWLIAKLLWDCSLDVEKLKADYYTNLFGPAAGAMRQYFDFLEETWCTQTLPSPRSNYRWMYDAKQLEIFPPEVCAKALAFLKRAGAEIERAPRSPEQRLLIQRRIRFFALSFGLTDALSRTYRLGDELARMAGAKSCDVGKAVALLDAAWQIDLRQAYDRVMALKEGQLTAIYPISFDELARKYVRRGGAIRMADRLVQEAVAAALAEGAAPARVAEAAATWLTRQAGPHETSRPKALTRMQQLARQTGVLVVPSQDQPPVVDGRIGEAEWGRPAYHGAFYRAYSFEPAESVTTIWARRAGGKLYLAMDCPAKHVGAAVTGRDTDGRYPPRMRLDTAVSICLVRAGAPFQRIMVNAAGSVQDFGSGTWDVCQARTRRTATGWQVEMAIDVDRTNAAPAAVAKGPTRVCISRYDRLPPAEARSSRAASPRTVCTTLSPVADIGGHVGHGNHEHLMAFIWGPRLLYR